MVNGKIITAVPAVKQSATLYFLEKGTNQFELSLADDNGVLRTLFTGSGGGGGTTPPIKDVLTAGNDLDGKHFEGVLKSVDADVPNNVSSTFNSDKDSVSYNRTTNDESTSFDVSSRGVSFNSSNSSTNENTHFEATQSLRYNKTNSHSDVTLDASDYALKYSISDRSMPGNDMEFRVEKERATYSIPYRDPMNPMAPATPLRYEVGAEGIKADKYLKPTQDEQYVQKKYVDEQLGGKPEIIFDNIYITTDERIGFEITVKGLDNSEANAILKRSRINGSVKGINYMVDINDTSKVFNFYNRTVSTDPKVHKFTFEVYFDDLTPWATPNYWANPFFSTFRLELKMDPSSPDYIKSEDVYFGDKYRGKQQGTIFMNLGYLAPLSTSGTSVKFFEIATSYGRDTISIENSNIFTTIDVPLGSYNRRGNLIEANGIVLANPTPGQVTDWELTIKVTGSDAVNLSPQDASVIAFDGTNFPVAEVPLILFDKKAGTIIVTLRTINQFRNIIGPDKGFKFGIRFSNYAQTLNTKFELTHINRISHSVA